MVKVKQPSKSKSKSIKIPSVTQMTQKTCRGSRAAVVLTSCSECAIDIGDDARALQCERCLTGKEKWKCADCLGLTDELYDLLVSTDRHGLHWFCNNCEAVVLEGHSDNMDRMLAAVDEMGKSLMEAVNDTHRKFEEKLNLVSKEKSKETELLNKLEERLCQLETNHTPVEIAEIQQIAIKVDELNHNLDIESTRAEEAEIQKRSTSVIIHGISESSSDDTDQRITDDSVLIAAMMHELDADDVKVEKLIRLGKRPSSTDDKPRPLKMIVDSVDKKVKIIRKAKNLRSQKEGDWTKVVIHQDLTPRQREARKKLVQELKTRTQNGENDLIIFNGKVVKKRWA